MLRVSVTRGKATEGVRIAFPVTPAEIGEAYEFLDAIGIDEPTRIIDVECEPFRLKNYLRNVDMDDSGNIRMLNRLAETLDGFRADDLKKLAGALDAESVEGMAFVCHVADTLDDYVLIHNVTTPLELGKFLAKYGYLSIPERLEPYIDYASIGEAYYAERGGAFCGDGYVLRKRSLNVCLREGERTQTEKFWLDKGRGELRWIHYDPSSDAGGQYVDICAPVEVLREALEKYSDPDTFKKFIGNAGKQYIVDCDSMDFEGMDDFFLVSGCDFTELTEAAMEQIQTFVSQYPTETINQTLGGI